MNNNTKQLYQKNIFLQKTKDKCNPDLIKKKEEADKSRKVNVFKKSSITYNSITNKTPTNIKTQKDLELEKDNVITNIESIVLQKKKERETQEIQFKPQKQKLLPDENIHNQKNENFIELKSEQKEYINSQKKVIESNKNKYNDIMSNLKSLGIIK
jgi:hypothetical protein